MSRIFPTKGNATESPPPTKPIPMKPKTPAILSLMIAIPALASAAVDFVKDVQPILEYNCVRCHNPKATAVEKGDTSVELDTKAKAIRGKTIVPGDAEKSKAYTTTLLPDDNDKLMPPLEEIKKGSSARLGKAETDTLKLWITEGATWPDGVTLVARKKEKAVDSSAEALVVAEIAKRIAETSKEKAESEMKPYSTEIPGTDVSYDMLPIPGGKFKMGSPENEKGRGEDEGPVHEVEIAPFWMEKTEVTWNEFQLFMYPEEEKKARVAKNLSADLNKLTDAVSHPTQPYVEMSFGMGTDGFPAISMTQHAANKYCQWLSAKTGHFYRLPTEAEWEYAARAGTTTAYFWGDDASKIGEYCWWGRNSDFKYQKVGKKKANPWGLHDILGNVAEWTLDQYDPAYYKSSPASNPWNRATKPYPHVARGGSWDDEDATKLRVAVRKGSSAEWKRQDPQLPKSIWYHTDAQFLGFRIVRPLKVPTPAEMQAYWNSGVEKDDSRLNRAE
jgi:formylglycine-generating enzyme required for sulfatase activity